MQKPNFICEDTEHGELRTPTAQKRLMGAIQRGAGKRAGRTWTVIEGAPEADIVLLRLSAQHRRALLPMRDIHSAILESRSLLDLQDDWDENGSPAITPETWARATAFVTRTARLAWERLGVEVAAPRILPGSDGGIDIEWFDDNRELLITIPADPDAPASFYGDDRGKLKIKGTFAPSSVNLGIVEWLTSKP